jgi:hypothetical protein
MWVTNERQNGRRDGGFACMSIVGGSGERREKWEKKRKIGRLKERRNNGDVLVVLTIYNPTIIIVTTILLLEKEEEGTTSEAW